MQSQMENYPVPSRFHSIAKSLGIDLLAQKKTDGDKGESRVLFARFKDGKPTVSKVYPHGLYNEAQAFSDFLAVAEQMHSHTPYPLSQDFHGKAKQHGLRLKAWIAPALHSAEDILYVLVMTEDNELLRVIEQDKFDIGDEKEAVDTAINAGKEMLADR